MSRCAGTIIFCPRARRRCGSRSPNGCAPPSRQRVQARGCLAVRGRDQRDLQGQPHDGARIARAATAGGTDQSASPDEVRSCCAKGRAAGKRTRKLLGGYAQARPATVLLHIQRRRRVCEGRPPTRLSSGRGALAFLIRRLLLANDEPIGMSESWLAPWTLAGRRGPTPDELDAGLTL